MSKGSKRRPFDRVKWAQNFDKAFGVLCSRCGARIRIHEAKPLHDGRGEPGVLCPLCQDCRDKQ